MKQMMRQDHNRKNWLLNNKVSEQETADIQIITFGCRLNSYESEVMRDHANKSGLPNSIIINSCAVTAEAERQLRQSIRKSRKKYPHYLIIVTGCAAQIKCDHYAAMKEVDFVLGNDLKMKLVSYQEIIDRLLNDTTTNKILTSDIHKAKDTALHLVKGFEGRTRAFVQVQNGCDYRCTYCIIPYGRGPSRSVNPTEIVKQVQMLVDEGYPEIALTGVDITSFGADLSPTMTLGQLIRLILKSAPKLQWLRLSSLDPAALDDDLWDLIEHEPRLLPYLHLSLQAGDNMILKRMARRHSREDALILCQRAKKLRPDVVFGADFIAGFPTETDEMADNTLQLVKETGITWLHVFPYSERDGTPAAKIPNQVKVEVRKARAAKLREVGKQAVQHHLTSLIGKDLTVHVEKPNLGRTKTFAEVIWNKDQPENIGTLIQVKAIGIDGNKLIVERKRS